MRTFNNPYWCLASWHSDDACFTTHSGSVALLHVLQTTENSKVKNQNRLFGFSIWKSQVSVVIATLTITSADNRKKAILLILISFFLIEEKASMIFLYCWVLQTTKPISQPKKQTKKGNTSHTLRWSRCNYYVSRKRKGLFNRNLFNFEFYSEILSSEKRTCSIVRTASFENQSC